MYFIRFKLKFYDEYWFIFCIIWCIIVYICNFMWWVKFVFLLNFKIFRFSKYYFLSVDELLFLFLRSNNCKICFDYVIYLFVYFLSRANLRKVFMGFESVFRINIRGVILFMLLYRVWRSIGGFFINFWFRFSRINSFIVKTV